MTRQRAAGTDERDRDRSGSPVRSLMTGLAVFRPTVPDGFEWVIPVDEADSETFRSFDGTPRRASWRPVPVTVLRSDEDGEPWRAADLPWLGSHVLVVSARAAERLGEQLQRDGELLPLACADAALFVFNPLRVVDALDEEHSDLVRFAGGRVMRITRHAFRRDRLGDVGVFKVPQLLRGSLFMTAEFVDRLRATGFEGTDFERVWSSESSHG